MAETEAAYYRLPIGLKGRIARQAARNGRTANAEVVKLLQLGLEPESVSGVMQARHLAPGEIATARNLVTGAVAEVVGEASPGIVSEPFEESA